MASSRVLSPESSKYANNRPAPDIHLQNFAATVIQRHFRGWRVWRWYQLHKHAVVHAQQSQQSAEEHALKVHHAAYVIQNAWRSYQNKKIYEYYRDLIQFRERGDPKELLQSINARLARHTPGCHSCALTGSKATPSKDGTIGIYYCYCFIISTLQGSLSLLFFAGSEATPTKDGTIGICYCYCLIVTTLQERGDPKELLRSINPREGQLADAAAGIHVRFRMGGSVFPPIVFYKIFTHRPVLDIGSFCPRDYAQEVRVLSGEIHNKPTQAQLVELRAQQEQLSFIKAKKKAVHRHVEDFDFDETLREYLKPDGSVGVRSTRGWYDRIENNGWRPISERILVDEDPVTTASKMKKMPFFHFNPAQRRYGYLLMVTLSWCSFPIQPGTETVRVLADGSTGNSQNGGPHIDDLDFNQIDFDQIDPMADDLLNWTMGLDFENYVDDWTSMATTLGSEAFLPDDESYLPEVPAPSHNFYGAMASAGVPVAPYQGGTSAASGATSTANLRS
eukprot:gene22634-29776_t